MKWCIIHGTINRIIQVNNMSVGAGARADNRDASVLGNGRR